jgi:hypothetical protein
MSESNVPFVVKSWHVFLTVLMLAGTLLAGYVAGKTQTQDQLEQHERRITQIEQQSVNKELVLQKIDSIDHRLQRIEDGLDRERALRGLH